MMSPTMTTSMMLPARTLDSGNACAHGVAARSPRCRRNRGEGLIQRNGPGRAMCQIVIEPFRRDQRGCIAIPYTAPAQGRPCIRTSGQSRPAQARGARRRSAKRKRPVRRRTDPTTPNSLHLRDVLDHAAHAGLAYPRAGCPRQPWRKLLPIGPSTSPSRPVADGACRQGGPQVGAAGAVCAGLRNGRRRVRAVHRAAPAGPRARREQWRDGPNLVYQVVPVAAAMVAQRHHRDRRSHQAARERRRVLAADSRHGLARTSSPPTGGAAEDIRETGGRTGISWRGSTTCWRIGSESSAAGRRSAPRRSRSRRAVAATPGKTVLRNRLIELIQYAPPRTVRPADPDRAGMDHELAILDLSPANSAVRYLIEQGFGLHDLTGRTRRRRTGSRNG